MKKFGIITQLLLHNAVHKTAIQNFYRQVFFQYLHYRFPSGIDRTYSAVINKNKTQSFQLPK